MKIYEKNESRFITPPAGSYSAVATKVIDLGTQTGQFGSRRQFCVVWELDELMDSGKPYIVSQFYTASLNEKSTLRRDLEAWRGRAFTREELAAGVDTVKLIGLPCLLTLVDNGEGRTKVGTVSKLPRTLQAIKPVGETVYFSLEPGDFVQSIYDGLSEGLKKMIARSPEYQAATRPKRNGGATLQDLEPRGPQRGGGSAAAEAFEDLEDSIPF
jgi:hypothetical protein